MNILILATPNSLRQNAFKELITGAIYGSESCNVLTLPSMLEHVRAHMPLHGDVKPISEELISSTRFHIVIYSNDLTKPETLEVLYQMRNKGTTLVELPTELPQPHIDTFYTQFNDDQYTDPLNLIIPIDKVTKNFRAIRFEKFELPIEDGEYMKFLLDSISKQVSPNDTYYLGVEALCDKRGQRSLYFAKASVDSYKVMCELKLAYGGIAYLYEKKQEYTKAQAIARASFIQPVEVTGMRVGLDNGPSLIGNYGGITVDFRKRD